jgi:hypothetical protein
VSKKIFQSLAARNQFVLQMLCPQCDRHIARVGLSLFQGKECSLVSALSTSKQAMHKNMCPKPLGSQNVLACISQITKDFCGSGSEGLILLHSKKSTSAKLSMISDIGEYLVIHTQFGFRTKPATPFQSWTWLMSVKPL